MNSAMLGAPRGPALAMGMGQMGHYCFQGSGAGTHRAEQGYAIIPDALLRDIAADLLDCIFLSRGPQAISARQSVPPLTPQGRKVIVPRTETSPVV